MRTTFPFIDNSGDLPQRGDHEDLVLEFKARVDKDTGEELAKDISALANTMGGVIVVGAAEDNTNRPDVLSAWVDYSAADAETNAKRYRNAARDLCHPSPSILAKVIEREPGKFVTVVNVAPLITGQVVGVKSKRSEEPKVDAWAFFRRVGTNNVDMSPEDLPMIMDARLRRSVLLLRSIPSPRRVHVRDAASSYRAGVITSIDEDRNAFTLDMDKGSTVTCPLDAVRFVYVDNDGVTWRLFLDVPFMY